MGAVSSVRAVSLVPSITETLRAWERDPIACTAYCEQPDLPTVGGTKNPDIAAIVALRPDVVLMDEQENRREDAAALAAAGIDVVAVDVRSLATLDPALAVLAERVGVARPAPIAPGRPYAPVTRRAFVPIWRRPWMTIGPHTYASSLLHTIGIRNVFDDAASDYPEVALATAAACAPDVVLAPTEPYRFRATHLAELAELAPVVEVDGRDLFWWGVRTPHAIERLAHRLANPDS